MRRISVKIVYLDLKYVLDLSFNDATKLLCYSNGLYVRPLGDGLRIGELLSQDPSLEDLTKNVK